MSDKRAQFACKKLRISATVFSPSPGFLGHEQRENQLIKTYGQLLPNSNGMTGKRRWISNKSHKEIFVIS